MYDVVVKKYHIRHLISWWVSCIEDITKKHFGLILDTVYQLPESCMWSMLIIDLHAVRKTLSWAETPRVTSCSTWRIVFHIKATKCRRVRDASRKLGYFRDSTRQRLLCRSKSFKVVNVYTNRKAVCDFLLVNNTVLHPSSHRHCAVFVKLSSLTKECFSLIHFFSVIFANVAINHTLLKTRFSELQLNFSCRAATGVIMHNIVHYPDQGHLKSPIWVQIERWYMRLRTGE